MSSYYRDEPIPRRSDGKSSRPVSAARRHSGSHRTGPEVASSWNMITEEELFGTRRRMPPMKNPSAFSPRLLELFAMIANYQISEKERTSAFLEQARFMENYEESGSYIYQQLNHVFVGYQEMSPEELRCYFAWRTLVRKQTWPDYHREFARLYAAELVNLVGVSGKEEAFERLLRLQAWSLKARKNVLALGDPFAKCVRDFIIAWNMPPELVQAYCVEDMVREEENLSLQQLQDVDDGSLFRVICALAGSQITRSRYLETVMESASHIIPRVFRNYCAAQKQRGEKTLAEQILGEKSETPYTVFAWLPFRTVQVTGFELKVDAVSAYSYRLGKWYQTRYPALRGEEGIRVLKELVRECDRVMRIAFHFHRGLPDRLRDKNLEQMILRECELWLKEEKRRSMPEVHVDLSKLSSIRRSADVTRDRLLEGTDEENDFLFNLPDTSINIDAVPGPADSRVDNNRSTKMDVTSATTPAADVNPAPAVILKSEPIDNVSPAPAVSSQGMGAETEGAGIFTALESTFLNLLLNGEESAGFFKAHALMPAVFVDAINEKAFDEIGDSIVEEDDRGWRIVEDYEEDVREMLSSD